MQDDDGMKNIPRLIREKEIWNEALEDAAKTAEKYEANMIAYEIRMRKKK